MDRVEIKVGQRWKSSAGNTWEVLAILDNGRVRVWLVGGRPDDTFVWLAESVSSGSVLIN